ncbi:MAG: disulfide bond formation protein B [Gammaproteobacteria bacterium]|jgi:disulfide bond formation protein DsbB
MTTGRFTRRHANFAGFLACAGMMGFALYAEHVLQLEPCPLCVFQRVATIGLGLLFLLAALHNPAGWGSRVWAALIVVAAGIGASIAGRHVWIQSLPPDEVPACGAGLDYLLDTVPLVDVIREVFTGSGECAELKWSFLGLSMPAWVLICMLLLGLFGLIANLRLPARRL